MRKRLASLLAVALVVVSSLVATAAPASAACFLSWTDRSDDSATITGDFVNYRNGPYTSCSSFGQWNTGTAVYLHCWVSGQGITVPGTGSTYYVWWHVRRAGTQQNGWVTAVYTTAPIVFMPPNTNC